MRITPATADDVAAVTDLWVALAEGQRDHGSTLLGAANRNAVRESLIRHAVTGELLVAREDDDFLGFVSFSPEHGDYERDERRGVVENLYVIPERRGDGVGSALLDAAEDALADAGVETVSLEAMAANERARTFYRNHGYELRRVELAKSMAENDGQRGDDGSA